MDSTVKCSFHEIQSTRSMRSRMWTGTRRAVFGGVYRRRVRARANRLYRLTVSTTISNYCSTKIGFAKSSNIKNEIKYWNRFLPKTQCCRRTGQKKERGANETGNVHIFSCILRWRIRFDGAVVGWSALVRHGSRGLMHCRRSYVCHTLHWTSNTRKVRFALAAVP